ncbi:MAG: hypothetical protein AB1486_15250 [Planctomycetota bacterium]
MIAPRETGKATAGQLLGLLVLALVAWRVVVWVGDRPAPEESPAVASEATSATLDPATGVRMSLSVTPARQGKAPILPPLEPLARDPFRPYPVASLPPEAPSGAPGPAPPAGPSPADFRLEGLALGEGTPLAIVNGRIVGPGDLVGEARVVSIDRSGVTLEAAGRSLQITLRESTDNRDPKEPAP